MSKVYDAVVIGAGFAGLIATREMANAGLDVLLLEARDRVGGRTWTAERLGHDLELGGTWVHWVQPHTWAEITRYDRQIVRSPAAEEASWLRADGSRVSATLQDFMELITPAHEQFFSDVAAVMPRGADPLLGTISDLDHLSIADRFQTLTLSEEEKSANESVWVGHVNAPLEDVGLSSAMRWTAASGGSWQVMHEASATYRVQGGMSEWTSLIADSINAPIMLGTKVQRITDTGSEVRVVTESGEEIHSKKIVSTLPASALAGIDFESGLPAAWETLKGETVASRGVKVWVKVRGNVKRFFAYGRATSTISVLKSEYYGTDHTILVGFGPNHDAIDFTDLASLQKAVDEVYPGLEVTDVAIHDWMADELAGNTWMTHRPGQLTRLLEKLQEPHGAIHFASTENANLWGGFIDGAIESGIREAQRIIKELRPRE